MRFYVSGVDVEYDWIGTDDRRDAVGHVRCVTLRGGYVVRQVSGRAEMQSASIVLTPREGEDLSAFLAGIEERWRGELCAATVNMIGREA